MDPCRKLLDEVRLYLESDQSVGIALLAAGEAVFIALVVLVMRSGLRLVG